MSKMGDYNIDQMNKLKPSRPDETKYEWEIGEMHESFPLPAPVIYAALQAHYSFDDCAKAMHTLFKEKFVYVGDNHIALHHMSGEHLDASGKDLNPRLFMIIAKPQYQTL